jgi:uncharacterized protein YbjT (DUF2867 family)
MAGVHTAYYFVQSRGSASNLEEERETARNFGKAASQAGVRQVIYLRGLGVPGGLTSSQPRPQEVGDILRQSGVPVIEFRASIVIGAGSLAFEMIRALVERLPVMLCPRWVSTPAQPIAIEDLINYMVQALDRPIEGSRVFEIGGADKVSYGDVMREYARQRGLRRLMVSVPVLAPRLSGLWLGLVTPLYARMGGKVIESFRNPTVVRDESVMSVFAICPMGLTEAIGRALRKEDHEFAETRWSDALSSGVGLRTWAGVRFGTRVIDSRVAEVNLPPAAVFRPIRRIGGSTGWYYANYLWRIRGFFDLLVGGVGLRRGRRHPDSLAVGDAVDFWRVEAFEPDRRLRLAAEMKLFGRAWLEFEVEGDSTRSSICQTAIFDPVGLLGLAYWYALYPVHRWLFAGMLRGIVAECQREQPPS